MSWLNVQGLSAHVLEGREIWTRLPNCPPAVVLYWEKAEQNRHYYNALEWTVYKKYVIIYIFTVCFRLNSDKYINSNTLTPSLNL